MKKISGILLLLLLIISCKKETKFDYPLIITGEVTNISIDGAVLNAKIVALGNENINEYGFVWGTAELPDINSSKIELANPSLSVISVKITNDLAPNTKYYVRAFARNSKYIVYGKSVSFQSQGSLPPVILDFNPKHGSNGDQITITGENFSGGIAGNTVKFGVVEVKIDSAKDDKLVVTLPLDLHISGIVNIAVQVANRSIISSNTFTLDGVIIESVNNKYFMGSDSIVITGKNFSRLNSENFVYLNGVSLEILKSSENQLIIKVPYDVIKGEYTLSVKSNNKTAFFSDKINIYSPWEKVETTASVLNRKRLAGTAIGDVIYLGMGYTSGMYNYAVYNDLWAFNTITKSWSQCSDLPGDDTREKSIGFSLNGKGYFGFGDYLEVAYNYIWEYDPPTNLWKRAKLFPGNRTCSTCDLNCQPINSKVYIGIDNYPEFWEYDTSSDNWVQRENLPNGNTHIKASFSIDQYGYFLLDTGFNLTGGEFWRYDPVSQIWTRKADFAGRERCFAKGFSLNSYGYIGFTDNGRGIDYSDLWRYNAQSDTWDRMPDIPIESTSYTQVFSFKNNAYVLFDASDYNTGQMWNFNPNKK